MKNWKFLVKYVVCTIAFLFSNEVLHCQSQILQKGSGLVQVLGDFTGLEYSASDIAKLNISEASLINLGCQPQYCMSSLHGPAQYGLEGDFNRSIDAVPSANKNDNILYYFSLSQELLKCKVTNSTLTSQEEQFIQNIIDTELNSRNVSDDVLNVIEEINCLYIRYLSGNYPAIIINSSSSKSSVSSIVDAEYKLENDQLVISPSGIPFSAIKGDILYFAKQDCACKYKAFDSLIEFPIGNLRGIVLAIKRKGKVYYAECDPDVNPGNFLGYRFTGKSGTGSDVDYLTNEWSNPGGTHKVLIGRPGDDGCFINLSIADYTYEIPSGDYTNEVSIYANGPKVTEDEYLEVLSYPYHYIYGGTLFPGHTTIVHTEPLFAAQTFTSYCEKDEISRAFHNSLSKAQLIYYTDELTPHGYTTRYLYLESKNASIRRVELYGEAEVVDLYYEAYNVILDAWIPMKVNDNSFIESIHAIQHYILKILKIAAEAAGVVASIALVPSVAATYTLGASSVAILDVGVDVITETGIYVVTGDEKGLAIGLAAGALGPASDALRYIRKALRAKKVNKALFSSLPPVTQKSASVAKINKNGNVNSIIFTVPCPLKSSNSDCFKTLEQIIDFVKSTKVIDATQLKKLELDFIENPLMIKYFAQEGTVKAWKKIDDGGIADFINHPGYMKTLEKVAKYQDEALSGTTGNVKYYRVQTEHPDSKILKVETNGNLTFNKPDVNLNLSTTNRAHADYYAAEKIANGNTVEIIEFEVPKTFDIQMKQTAVPQHKSTQNLLNPDGTAPKIVDPLQPGDPFELPGFWNQLVQQNYIPGTAKTVN